MRVALVNEGTYPYVAGGVSTWCDQLVRGMTDVSWDLVAIVGTEPDRQVAALPRNVRSLTTVPVWGPARQARARPAQARLIRHQAEAAASMLCWGMLVESPSAAAAFAVGLRELSELARPTEPPVKGRFGTRRGPTPTGPGHVGPAQGGPAQGGRTPGGLGTHPLAGVVLTDILLDAWRRAVAGGTRLPRLTLHEADQAAAVIEHAVRPLAVSLPSDVDVCHANANGLASMVALAAKWRADVPFLMTEHGVYLRERYLALADPAAHQGPGVKWAVLRFYRALARLAYAEADSIAPVSSFNSRWAVRHGADPASVSVIGNGVDPERYPPLAVEVDEPVLSWVGRIDPLKDLETLIHALAVTRRTVPDARLHLAGLVPAGNEAYARGCLDLVDNLGLGGAVHFTGPVASSREVFAAGQVAVLSSVSEGMPYTVLEAMMCGRATVSTDVGGVAEAVGEAGVIVGPRDPEAFGAACAELLTDSRRRHHLAEAGRLRARRVHTMDRCLRAYADRYAHLRGAARPGAGVIGDPVVHQ
ncbi:MAG TPA: GT4 family glycosyltransferase PelF [Micromonosporaceae bacterium]|nr:GT4 family glycosyltransferase PelF [Micromonosporaceae bacterium]